MSLALLLASMSEPLAQPQQGVTPPAPQVYEGRFHINVVRLKRMMEWPHREGRTLPPDIRASVGSELVVVELEVKKLDTGEVDTSAALSKFRLEDATGRSYPSPLIFTTGREIPFGVPIGFRPTTFWIEHLRFDVEQLPIGLP